MRSLWRGAPALVAAIFITGLSLPAAAQSATAQKEYTPSVGQEGKDVIWVPTPQSLVDRMLQMANVKPNEVVYDLGSGDGRTVITAAKKFGARATGIEYNPDMVELSKRNAEKEGVSGRAQFMKADIFQTDFSQADVLTLYLLPSLNVKLRPTILKMKPGTRVVSHAFTMDDWQPDQTDSSEGRTAYMWIVPAPVEGTWTIDGGREMVLRQKYQQVDGSVKTDSQMLQIRDGKLRGDQISFGVNNATYTGRVNGDRIEGTVKPATGGETKFVATRRP